MNPITAAHLHLVLSHVPVLAILFGAGWLAFGMWRRNRDIEQAAMAMFVAAAVIAVPAYLTGEPASGAVKGLPGFSDSILQRHQAAAGFALGGCVVLGIVALAGVIVFRSKPVARWFTALLLTAALLVGCLVSWTSNLGGQVRHSEIRDYDPQSE